MHRQTERGDVAHVFVRIVQRRQEQVPRPLGLCEFQHRSAQRSRLGVRIAQQGSSGGDSIVPQRGQSGEVVPPSDR